MCLFPKLVRNPKYKVNKKNKGNVPHMTDSRVGYVPIGCGWCMECMKQKANHWKVRLMEDIKEHKNGRFITLTFSNEAYTKLAEGIEATGYLLDNEIATKAVRYFLERWRRKHKKSVRHWLITELGGNGTENIHLHGIIWTDTPSEINRIWNNGKFEYGYVWDGTRKNGQVVNYVNEKTVNYITKYVTKADLKHKSYKPKILCSAGIGRNYIDRYDAKKNKFQGTDTQEYYKTRQGYKMGLPIYWRNKLYSEEERELLWIQKLDENVRYIGGEKISADDEEGYKELLKFYREKNARLGYGSPENWSMREYEEQRRKLLQDKRMANIKNEKQKKVKKLKKTDTETDLETGLRMIQEMGRDIKDMKLIDSS